jgi:hypothetical protein
MITVSVGHPATHMFTKALKLGALVPSCHCNFWGLQDSWISISASEQLEIK